MKAKKLEAAESVDYRKNSKLLSNLLFGSELNIPVVSLAQNRVEDIILISRILREGENIDGDTVLLRSESCQFIARFMAVDGVRVPYAFALPNDVIVDELFMSLLETAALYSKMLYEKRNRKTEDEIE